MLVINCYNPFARLEHKKKLVGIRFSSGIFKEHCDISIKDLAKILGCKESEVEDNLKNASPYDYVDFFPHNCSSYTPNDDVLVIYKGMPSRILAVDENMIPIRDYNKNVVFNRCGNLKASFPCKKPENVLKAVQTLDGILYGSNLERSIPFWKITNIELENDINHTSRSPIGMAMTEKVFAFATLFLSVSPREACWDDVFEQCNSWAKNNGVTDVQFILNHKDNFYILTIVVSNHTVSPFVSKPIVFTGKQNVQTNNIRNNAFVHDKYICNCFHTEDDDTYIFSEGANEKACGATYAKSNLPTSKVFEKRYYDNARVVVHNGELHELRSFRHPKYIKTILNSLSTNFSKSFERVYENTFLSEILDSFTLPEHTFNIIDSNAGEIVYNFELSPNDFIYSPESVIEQIKDEFNKATYRCYDWNKKAKFKNCATFVNYDDKMLSIGLRIELESKFSK